MDSGQLARPVPPVPPAWLDELHVEGGPPWHAMATRALVDARWPGVDDEGRRQLVEKARILDEHRGDVVAARAGSDAAAREAAEFTARAAGQALRASGRPPLETAALLVPDDLCVLVRRDGRWCLDAGVVCFPSLWRLPDKLGLPMAEVHGPVPAYAEELAARVDRLLDRLRPGRAVWRRNWFVHDRPDLFLPGPAPAAAPPEVPGGLWLRSERQTLHRLPATGAVLFTIRTQHAPFAALAARPDLAGRMAATIAAWPRDLAAYRSAEPWRAGAVAWLRAAGER